MPIWKRGPKGGEAMLIFTEEDVLQVEELASRLTVDQIADYFGVSDASFRSLRARQPEVAEAYKRGKSKTISSVPGKLIKLANEENLTAIMFYLKTQAGWREKDAAVDISVTNDTPKLNITFSDEKKEV